MVSCGIGSKEREQLKGRTDVLLDAIGTGTANEMFPVKYFPKEQTVNLMAALKDYCDFKHRKGGFIDNFFQKDLNGTNRNTLVYEFYLRCDTARFLITYSEQNNSWELIEFKIEPVNHSGN